MTIWDASKVHVFLGYGGPFSGELKKTRCKFSQFYSDTGSGILDFVEPTRSNMRYKFNDWETEIKVMLCNTKFFCCFSLRVNSNIHSKYYRINAPINLFIILRYDRALRMRREEKNSKKKHGIRSLSL